MFISIFHATGSKKIAPALLTGTVVDDNHICCVNHGDCISIPISFVIDIRRLRVRRLGGAQLLVEVDVVLGVGLTLFVCRSIKIPIPIRVVVISQNLAGASLAAPQYHPTPHTRRKSHQFVRILVKQILILMPIGEVFQSAVWAIYAVLNARFGIRIAGLDCISATTMITASC